MQGQFGVREYKPFWCTTRRRPHAPHMDNLHDELLHHGVLQHVSRADMPAVRLVCLRLRFAMERYVTRVAILLDEHQPDVDMRIVLAERATFYRRLPALRTVCLPQLRFYEEGVHPGDMEAATNPRGQWRRWETAIRELRAGLPGLRCLRAANPWYMDFVLGLAELGLCFKPHINVWNLHLADDPDFVAVASQPGCRLLMQRHRSEWGGVPAVVCGAIRRLVVSLRSAEDVPLLPLMPNVATLVIQVKRGFRADAQCEEAGRRLSVVRALDVQLLTRRWSHGAAITVLEWLRLATQRVGQLDVLIDRWASDAELDASIVQLARSNKLDRLVVTLTRDGGRRPELPFTVAACAEAGTAMGGTP